MMPLGVGSPKACVAWSTSPQVAAAVDAHGAGRRVDADAVHRARGRSPGRRRTCRGRRRCGRRRGRRAAGRCSRAKLTRGDDVGDVGAAGDQRRALVDHARCRPRGRRRSRRRRGRSAALGSRGARSRALMSRASWVLLVVGAATAQATTWPRDAPLCHDATDPLAGRRGARARIVRSDYASACAGARPPVPARRPAFPFVGRARELERLRALMPRADGGGPAGGARSAARPGRARAGWCASSPPRPPRAARSCSTAPATRSCARRTGRSSRRSTSSPRAPRPAELRAALGAGGGELARLLPELPGPRRRAPAGGDADPDTERHRLHTAVADLLAGVSRASGRSLLVLEDVHWADAPTLLPAAPPRARGRTRATAAARHVPRRRRRGAGDARRDARRPAPLRRRRPAAARRPLRRRGGGVRAARRRATPDPSCAQLAEAIRDADRRQRVPGLRAVARAAGDRRGRARRRRDPAPPAAGGARHARRACARWWASASRAWPRRRIDLLELGGDRRARVRARGRAPGRGARRGRAAARALDEAVAQRHDRGAAVAPAGLPLRARAGAPRALRPPRRAAPGGAAPARRRGARARRGALRARAGRPRPPLRAPRRRSAAAERAVDYNLLRRAGGERRALAFDDAAERLRTALELGVEDRPSAPSVLLELGRRQPPRRQARRGARRRSRQAAQIARELGDAGAARAGGDRLRGRLLAPGVADRGAVELLEEARAALGDERLASCASACSPGWPARSTSGATASAARSCATTPSRWRGGSATATGLATVLMRSYWSRGTTSARGGARDADRGARPRRGARATSRSTPRRWPGGCRRSSRSATSSRRGAEVAVAARAAERTAQPFLLHVAEHYGSAIALVRRAARRRPRRWRVRSSEWSRLLTGRDASGVLRHPDVRRPPRAGRLAELAPAVRVLAGDPDRDGPWRPGLVALLAELGMEAEARRELARLAADGLEPLPGVAVARLAGLPHRRLQRRSATRRWRRCVYPELEPFARRQRDDRAPRRLLRRRRPLPRHAGGDARRGELAERALRARAGAQPRAWAPRPGSPTPRTSTARFLLGGAAPAAAARRRAARRGRGAGRAHRHAGAARRGSGALGAAAPPPACPTASPRARRRSSAWSPRGSSNREIGVDAVDQRAHRRQPRPQHPAQDRAARTAPRPPPTPTGTGSPDTGRSAGATSRPDAAVHDRARASPRSSTSRSDDVALIDEINADEGVRWLFSFLSADRRRTYCLYEAPSPEAIVAAARRADVPADAIVEVGAAAPSSPAACATGPTAYRPVDGLRAPVTHIDDA